MTDKSKSDKTAESDITSATRHLEDDVRADTARIRRAVRESPSDRKQSFLGGMYDRVGDVAAEHRGLATATAVVAGHQISTRVIGPGIDKVAGVVRNWGGRKAADQIGGEAKNAFLGGAVDVLRGGLRLK